MSEFINTIDSLGDELTLGKLIDGSHTEIKDNIITKLRNYLFYYNKNLAEVDLPNVISVGYASFQKCTSLTTVNLSNTITVGDYAFDDCSKLTTVNLPNATSIGRNAFNTCTQLTTVSLPSTTSMVSNTFAGSSNLKSVDLPKLTSICTGNFYNCNQLEVVNIPLATNVDDSAFYACSALPKIDLPNVTSIGRNAFAKCSNLKTLILRSSTMCTLSATGAFTSTPIKSGEGYIYVPRDLIDQYKSATNWSTFAAQFRVLEDYTKDGTTTGEWYMPSQTRKLIDRTITEVSSNATSVGDNAFYYCKNLTTVDIPNATSVGQYGFDSCTNLTTVDFPNVTKLDYGCFRNCSNLNTLILRSETMCTLSSAVLDDSQIKKGTGYIYVPKDLVETYKSDSKWSTYANQIRAIEDYPDVCGGV